MSEFQKIAHISQLPAEGEAKSFELNGRRLCLTRQNGKIGAIDGICPHRGAPLGDGYLDGGHLFCALHNWEYDPETGEGFGHADGNIDSYEVKIEGKHVYVRPREK